MRPIEITEVLMWQRYSQQRSQRIGTIEQLSPLLYSSYLVNLACILSAFLISFCAVFRSTQSSALIIVLSSLISCFLIFISDNT